MPEPEPPPLPRRRRRRRILWAAFAVLVVLPVLAAFGTLAALRAAGVRRAILARISGLLAEDYGLAFAAGDFSPLWLHRGIELRDLRVGAPGAAPVASAARVRVTVDLGSLRRRPLVVRALTADGLRVDLAAPLPQLPETREEAGDGPPVEIRRIAVRDAEVLGAPLAAPAAEWLRSWEVRQVEARGSYRGGRLDLEVGSGEAVLDRPGFGPQALQFAGRIGYQEKQPLRVEGLRVRGDGLRLAASGSVGLAPGAPSRRCTSTGRAAGQNVTTGGLRFGDIYTDLPGRDRSMSKPDHENAPQAALLGLRTAIYHVADLDRAKAWYASVLGIEPYFDQPFYVGFEVGGFELGLDPDPASGHPGEGGVAVYWGVEDADAGLARLLALGARRRSDVQEVGEGIRVATVTDPFGNVLGIIENPHFRAR